MLVQGRFARQKAKTAEKTIVKSAPAPVAAPPKLAVEPIPEPIEPLAEPVVAIRAADPAVQEEASQESGDRWMVLGLAALFVIFGIFLTVVVMIPE